MASNFNFSRLQSRAPETYLPKKLQKVKTISGGGSNSSSAKNIEAARREAAEKARKLAEEAARKAAAERAEAERQIALAKTAAEKQRLARAYVERRNAERELKRIEQQRRAIALRGGRVESLRSRDVKTGDQLQVIQTIDRKGNRVQQIKNLRTGDVEYSSFARPKRGGLVRQTGGVTVGKAQESYVSKIKTLDLGNGKIRVRLPNGREVDIKNSGRTVIGKRLAGKKLTFQDGILRKVDNEDLYKEKLGALNVSKKDNKIISSARARKLLTDYTSQADTLEQRLKNRARRGDLQRLAALQKKKNLTPAEKKRKERLTKSVAQGYKDAGKIVGLTIASSLLGLGVGSVDLARQLKANPVKTVKSLPKNLYEGIKQDLSRSKGSPVGALRVAVEWFVFAKALQGVGVAAKGTFRTVKTLTPKVFSAAERKFVKTSFGKDVVRVRKKVKNIQAEEAKRFKSPNQLKKDMALAKKIRKKSGKNVRSVVIGTDEYAKAIAKLEVNAELLGRNIGRKIINDSVKKGIKIGTTREAQIISASEKYVLKTLRQLKDFKNLKEAARFNKPYVTKLIKQGKIRTAKRWFNALNKRIGNLPVSRRINKLVGKVKGKVRTAKRKIRTRRKVAKTKREAAIRKFKKAQDYQRQLKKARMIRKRSKAKNIGVGNDDYIKAVAFLEEFAERIGRKKARQFLNSQARKKKLKIKFAEREAFVEKFGLYTKSQLKKIPEFKRLVEASKLNKPYAIAIRIKGRLATAKKFFSNLKRRVNNIPTVQKLNTLSKNIGRKVRDIKRKVSPKRIRKRIRRIRDVRKQKRIIRRSVKYRLQQARPITKIKIPTLKRISTAKKLDAFIDKLFREINQRQNLGLPLAKANKIKAALKKKVRTAIRNQDKATLQQFSQQVKELINRMNQKKNAPDIRVVEVTPSNIRIKPKKKIMTIKDFETKTPKGTYQEVKVGNQVLLQKTEQATKQIAKQRTAQKFKIVSVTKKSINLKPLVRFATARVAFGKAGQKAGQAFSPNNKVRQRSGLAPLTRQKSKNLQRIRSGSVSGSGVASNVKSKSKSRLRQKTKQVSKKKKPPVKPRIPKKPSVKRKGKSIQTYTIMVKKRGRNVRLNNRPLTLQGAKDYLAYNLDNQLLRTGFIVPLGKKKKVFTPPKSVKGYFSKVKRKLRPYKIRQGKKKRLLNGYIEKTKYIQDTKGEKTQATRLRKKKMTATQKKKMLANLKKARAAKKRKRKKK